VAKKTAKTAQKKTGNAKKAAKTKPKAAKGKSSSVRAKPPKPAGRMGGTEPAMAPRKGAPKTVGRKSQAGRTSSTKGVAGAKDLTRRQTPPPSVERDLPREKPLRKTRLTPEELNTFRDLLLTKRNELLGTVTQLREDALHKNRQESAGDLSSMPIHMADIGSDNWEQEFTLGLLANESELLREIEEALQRIENGTYGVCLGTNTHIQKRRLRAKPWAKYCIEYARELELRRRR
jgi:RNA polymerase-binding protein DksA